MNYAQKKLHTVTAELEKARATVAAFTALIDGEHAPQQITLTSLSGSVTCALPVPEDDWDRGVAATFYAEVENALSLRVSKLEEDQLYWCEEMVLLAKGEKEDAEHRELRRAAKQDQTFVSAPVFFGQQPVAERCPLLPELPNNTVHAPRPRRQPSPIATAKPRK